MGGATIAARSGEKAEMWVREAGHLCAPPGQGVPAWQGLTASITLTRVDYLA